MADNTPQNGTATIAADDIGGVLHQRMKVEYGADGSATDVSASTPLPTYGPNEATTGTITATDTVLGAHPGTGVALTGTPTASSYVALPLNGGEGVFLMAFSGTFGSGTIYFEASPNSTNGTDGLWTTLSCRLLGTTGSTLSDSTTTTGTVYRGTASGMAYIRARIINATSPSVTVTLRASDAAGPVALNAAIPAGSNVIGSTQISTTNQSPYGLYATVTGYGNLRVTNEATSLFFDSFDTGTALDTTVKWTTGGTVAPSVVTGALQLGAGGTSNATSYLNSKPTFAHAGVNWLALGMTVRFESINTTPGQIFYTGIYRFIGFGLPSSTPALAYSAGSTTTNTMLSGFGVEIDAGDGSMYPVVYDNGTRTRPTLLNGNANLNIGRTLADGQAHQFLFVMRSDAMIWYVDGTEVPVASYSYRTSGFSVPDIATLPIRFHQFNGATPTGTAVMRLGAVGIGDTGGNALSMKDPVYPWRQARVDSSSSLQVRQAPSSTGTITSVNGAAASTQLLAANTSRLGATFYNDSTAVLYLAMAGSASTTAYTVQVAAGGYYELPNASVCYTGAVFGIWSAANGAVRVTELT